MTDFTFLSPSSSPPPVAQQLQENTFQLSPEHILEPPLITFDDYSVSQTLEDGSAGDYLEDSPMVDISTETLFHHHNYSTFGDPDSDTSYPPSSAVTSGASSAIPSESDLPSAVASESELLLPSKINKPGFMKQTGIHNFFQVL